MYLDRRLWVFTEGVRARMVATILLGLLAAAAGVARLALLGWLLAKIFTGQSVAELVLPFLLTAAVMLLRGILEYCRTMMAHRTAAAVQVTLRRRLYEHVIALGPAYFGRERTGATLLTLIDGVEQLETYFGQYLPQLCVATLAPLGIFAFMAFLDLPLAGALFGFAIFTLVAPAAFHRWDRRAAQARQSSYAAYGAEFLDSVQGLGTLKSFGQSGARARDLAAKAHDLFRRTMWVLATNSLSRGITDGGIAIGAALALGIGAWRVADGEIGIGVLLIVLMMGVELFRPMRELRILLHQGMLGQSAAEGLFALLGAKPLVREAETGESPSAAELQPSLRFEGVNFSYPGGRKQAHRDLSFEIKAGERIGIVGPSGCGKSSIVRLALRLYDPDSGRVFLGGTDLRTLSFAQIRGHFAVVHQDTYLFHGTAEENIRFGKPDATREELEAAARSANAHDFISRLPQGYDTVIGERGVRLSGGQRQRIAIARALLRDAPFLVLDEALSAVDAENEAIIQQALDRLMKGRTVLILAHRLSSVIDADRILVLEDGALVEEGRHGALMAEGGVYAKLMAAQATEAVRSGDGEVPLAAPVTMPDATAPLEDLQLDQLQPADEILRAGHMGWWRATGLLMRLVRPLRGRVGLAFLLGVARVMAFIGVGVLSAFVVAAVRNGEPFGGLLIALYALAPFAGILHWLESWVAHDMAFRLLTEMRIALFAKLDALAPAYLLRRRSGDLVAIATQDIENVEFFFAHTVAPAFVALLVPAAVLAAVLFFGWPMSAALAPFLALIALSPFLMRKRVDRLASRASEAQGELNAHTVDTLQGLPEILAFRQEARRGAQLIDLVHRHHALRLPFFRDLTFQTALVETVTGLGGLAVVITGALLVSSGDLERTMLPLLTLLAMAAFLPVSEIANIGRQLADTLGGTRRLNAVHSEPVPVRDGPGVTSAEESDGGGVALELENVRFTYPGIKAPALEGVSLSLAAGSTLALVGPSGAGKTTLASLLMRFWDPEEGTVRLNGHDLKNWRIDDLRGHISLVAQDTYLFNDTIRANILIARPDASEAEVAAAVSHAALGDFTAALPDGLETQVGERGTRLSGGQRQRVAIARAFLKDAPVLILDEATSHLDALNEQAVRRALDELMMARTTIVIAHRLSTVRDADQIVVMDSGRVCEAGTHAGLLAKGGLYAALVSRQLAASAQPAAD
ncbi:MAG: Multidrug efflux ATP-binding/permease protein [Alphaproteobacteria bacterium MarineAlpha10_Bin2]|nr:MAG: Multidrug efflux ATP-binding/permease protein [Alphaproteobacteria bacterium MarineAlpha10_Bin2]